MEKVKIDIYGIDSFIKTIDHYINNLSRDYEENEKEIKDCRKDIEYLNTLKDGVEVTTMKEYMKLLERLDELTDGDYDIYNCGALIQLC